MKRYRLKVLAAGILEESETGELVFYDDVVKEMSPKRGNRKQELKDLEGSALFLHWQEKT
jgi:hypothetical protein